MIWRFSKPCFSKLFKTAFIIMVKRVCRWAFAIFYVSCQLALSLVASATILAKHNIQCRPFFKVTVHMSSLEWFTNIEARELTWGTLSLLSRTMALRQRTSGLCPTSSTLQQRTSRTSSWAGGGAATTTDELPGDYPTIFLPQWWTSSVQPRTCSPG